MTTILGLVMVYSWIHSTIIIGAGKDKSKRTEYENIVLMVGLVGFALFILGSL